MDDKDFKKVMTVIRNIQAKTLFDGEKCTIGDAIIEMAINYNNGVYNGIKEHKIVPYYYTEAQLEILINLVEIAKRNISNVKKTQLEEVIPQILELENDKDMLSLVDKIRNRATLIDVYSDYIKGHLTAKIKKYLKSKKNDDQIITEDDYDE